ncbi:MAG: amino acid ABC transporter ATP-binding protein [Pirellulales bacterium]
MSEPAADFPVADFIAFDNVRKAFGDRVVLDGVTLSVRTGETIALLGPSGGGKSTLLRTANALCDFDGGVIRVGPHQLSPSGGNGSQNDAVRQIRRLVGMVFQDFQLFPHLTALDNIIEAPMHVAGKSRAAAIAAARSLLDRVGLADRENAYPSQLSGGQKQRVAIARTLAMEPSCLLCDEITSALDPELKHEVLEVLDDLRRDGLTLILVTHEIGFARRAADRVVVLCDGRILEEGPPAAVLDSPQHERTRQFLERTLA